MSKTDRLKKTVVDHFKFIQEVFPHQSAEVLRERNQILDGINRLQLKITDLKILNILGWGLLFLFLLITAI